MSEMTLLITGAFCFGLTLLGVILTVIEFKKGNETAPQRLESDARESAKIYQMRRAA